MIHKYIFIYFFRTLILKYMAVSSCKLCTKLHGYVHLIRREMDYSIIATGEMLLSTVDDQWTVARIISDNWGRIYGKRWETTQILLTTYPLIIFCIERNALPLRRVAQLSAPLTHDINKGGGGSVITVVHSCYLAPTYPAVKGPSYLFVNDMAAIIQK